MRLTPSERNSILTGCGSSGVDAGVRQAAMARSTARPATAPNAAAVPVNDAIAPSTGPNSAPAIAAPKAEPISWPRRPGCEAATSHASAPVHEKALETPWTKRARSRAQTEFASPNATVVAANSERPMRTVGFTPKRAAAIPPGIAASSAPSGYIACNRPAPALPRPSLST